MKKKQQGKDRKIAKEIKNAEEKLLIKLNDKKERIKLEVYKYYITSLGAIDSHIKFINDEIKNIEFDPWDEDLYMYKKSCQTLREDIVKDMINKIKPDDVIEELIMKETYKEIDNLPIKELEKDNVLEFCISYKKGYNLGKELSKDKIDEIYHHEKQKKQRKTKKIVRK